MNKKSIFSINMIRARTKKKWSQHFAAQKIGIKRARLASYEEDRAEPSHEILIHICKIYGVESVDGLLKDAALTI